MKKSLIILGCLLVVLTFAVSGFSKAPQRKLAQDKGSEKVLGPVIGIERQMTLDIESCDKYFERQERKDYDQTYISYSCDVPIFQKNDEEEELSTSLSNVDYYNRRTLLKNICDRPYYLDINAAPNGFEIYSSSYAIESCPDAGKITKEEFLKTAKILIDKFPTITVKVMKVKK